MVQATPEAARSSNVSMAEWSVRSRAVLARGVTSSARERTVPLILARAEGGRVQDADGRWYVDLVNALGPVILGHADRRVTEAVRAQLDDGVLFGNHVGEIALAEALADRLPWAQTTCLLSSGSEAVNLALRIARATTGRPLIVKFEGQYHGWIDPMYVSLQGAAALPPGEDGCIPPTPGVPGSAADPSVLIVRWNDSDAIDRVFHDHGAHIASVILDPIAVGVGMPDIDDEFLQRLRTLCSDHGSILMFDEVLTGFRVSPIGAAGLVPVSPDIAIYAKAMANGFPISAVCGLEWAMASIDGGPLRPAGTYNGSPISVAAAIRTLELLDDTCYAALEANGARLQQGLEEVSALRGLPLTVRRRGSILQLMWGVHEPVRDHREVTSSDLPAVARLCEGALDGGALATPRGLLILNAAQGEADMDRAIAAFDSSAQTITG